MELIQKEGYADQKKYRAYKKTVSIVNESAISMFQGIAKDHISFLLESYDKNYDRYSFFGVDPKALVSSTRKGLLIQYRDGTKEEILGNPIDALKVLFNRYDVQKDPGELTMIGGLVGSIGYDFVRYLEILPDENPDEIGLETIQLMLVTEFIVIDHMAETLTAVVLDDDNAQGRVRGEKKAEELADEVFKTSHHKEAAFTRDGSII